MRRPSLTLVVVLFAIAVGASNTDAQVPDGRIVSQVCQKYEWDGDLLACNLVLAAGGGDPYAARHIAVRDGVDPAWSPDGSRIAFAGHERPGIFVVTLADWSIATLSTVGAAPSWSPDGSRLAFAAGELYVIGVDGSHLTELTNNVGFLGQPAWSPDGKTIAFDCEIDAGNRDICAVAADGTGLIRLTTRSGSDSGPAFSPDGSKIALTGNDYFVSVMNVDGTEMMELLGGGTDPAWSPDGTRIAFVVPFSGACNSDGLICFDFIFTINANGTDTRHVSSGNRPAWGMSSGPIAWITTPQCHGFVCDFDGSRSWAGDDEFASYTWTFGDGSTASGTAVSHTFAAYGTYEVRLTVIDTAGVTVSHELTVLFENHPPSGWFQPACSGLTCTFDASTAWDPDGISSYVWDFGDGTGASGLTASHTYLLRGIYTVTLTLTDNLGATRAITVSVTAVAAVHIGDLDGGSISLKNAWTAKATATVHDGSHRAMAGALVAGFWSDGGSGSCTTSSDGRCTVSGPGFARKTASISFTVASVTGTAIAYTPVQNHDPDGDSTGTSVTVGKP